MKKTIRTTIIIISASLVLATGCDDKGGDSGNGDAASKATQVSLAPAVDAYETVRVALAQDDLAAATAGAAALRDAAKAASLDALASAAEGLAAASPDDADAVRKAFGAASQTLIGALAKEPKLRDTLHVFECPMAKGYGKWVQRAEKLENPYMGKSMPSCGSASKWEA
ncbi:MAG: hypothetical protein ACE37F_01450 [Nannocystaceae bacterium]|nr:hypothetical protein [bacterium]